MKSYHKLVWLLAAASIFLFLAAHITPIYWPMFYYELKVPSPDNKYDLVVIRGESSAFSDSTYQINVFPSSVTPRSFIKGARLFRTSIWRNNDYLVYTSDNYPTMRWIEKNQVEIDIHEARYSPMTFLPIKSFGRGGTILVSLFLNSDNRQNLRP